MGDKVPKFRDFILEYELKYQHKSKNVKVRSLMLKLIQ